MAALGDTAGPRARILIVDDDERNSFAAVQALEPLGHELAVAKSGEDALRRLLTEDFAVILLDLHMPGMDGYETAQLIRQRRRTRDIPIVFLTAVFRDEAHLFKAYSAGAVDVVFKPVDPFVLRSKVQVLADLHLKTEEVRRQAEQERALLRENARINEQRLIAERALRRSQERQEAISACLPIVFHSRMASPPFDVLFISEGIETLTGHKAEDIVRTPALATSRIHPEDLPGVIEAVSGALTSGAYACEFRYQCADGRYRSFIDQGVLAPAGEGERGEIYGTLIDNTERRELEEQLAQAGRIEAVGRLTGGIAHDFNNLLTVILGNLDLMLPQAEPDSRMHRRLDHVRQAAERGQALTRQLLAFSRRQRLDPVALELNDLIRRFAPLLKQALGEGVRLALDLDPSSVVVRVDQAQMESALLNLAVNARDAMGHAGDLTISTSAEPDAERGAWVGAPHGWVQLIVSDTGVGMSPDVAERIFEPFFTTKEVGQGSGLGLSQVYGFVQQSGGQVSVVSTVGQGAQFVLTLPTVADPAQPSLPAPPAPTAQGGSERVLVVEDDSAVLEMAVAMFEALGYRVLTAEDGPKALAQLRSRRRIDLLFTDVVMPGGLSGIDLARKARDLRPGIGVLLTSGYLGSATPAGGDEFPLIDKPYERSALATKVRAILDGPLKGKAWQAASKPSGSAMASG